MVKALPMNNKNKINTDEPITNVTFVKEYQRKKYGRVTLHSLTAQKPNPSKAWQGNAHAHLLNEHMSNRKTLRGTIIKQKQTMAPVIITTITALGLATAGVVKVHEMSLPPIEETTTHKNHLKTVTTDENSEMTAYSIDTTTCKIDKAGRYVIDLDITSHAETTNDIILSVDLSVTGTDSRSEPWENKLKSVNCDSTTTNVWSDDGKVCIAALAPQQTRHVRLYPNLTGRSIPDISIDKIKSADVTVTNTVSSEENGVIHSVQDIDWDATLSEKADNIIITGHPKDNTDTNSYIISGILLDIHSEPFGTQREGGIAFPFGIVTFRTEMSTHGRTTNAFQIECATGDHATRAVICGIHKKTANETNAPTNNIPDIESIIT